MEIMPLQVGNVIDFLRLDRLPNKRTRYNTKRRAKDLEMIFSHWNTLPRDKTESKINIANVPPKIMKKYKRAITINAHPWRIKDSKSIETFEKIQLSGNGPKAGATMMSNSMEMLNIMHKALPTYNSKVITDIPAHFRVRYDDWDVAEDKGITVLRYWNNYRIATYYGKMGDQQSSLNYIDEALSLIPPLRKGEMPHKSEVLARVIRAMTLYATDDYDGALKEFRVCLAAIRLLDHCGKVDMADGKDILIQKTNDWSTAIMRLLAKIKLRDCNSRPYFSSDERLDLMKELGFGMYSASRLKCSSCAKTDLEVKLSLCSRCRNVWYCGKQCAKKAWSTGHKEGCDSGSGLVLPMKFPLPMMQRILKDIADPGEVSIMAECMDSRVIPLLLCKDPSTGKIFDVLFDEDVVLEGGDHTNSR